MAGFRLLHRVHGERPDGVRHAVVFGAAVRKSVGFAQCGGRWGHQRFPLKLRPVDSTWRPAHSNGPPQTPVDCLAWSIRRAGCHAGTNSTRSGSPGISAGRCAGRRKPMNGIIYLIGLIVVIMAILSFLGLR